MHMLVFVYVGLSRRYRNIVLSMFIETSEIFAGMITRGSGMVRGKLRFWFDKNYFVKGSR